MLLLIPADAPYLSRVICEEDFKLFTLIYGSGV